MKRIVALMAAGLALLPLIATGGKAAAWNGVQCNLSGFLKDLPDESPTESESQDLQFTREEEKLARDVYLSLNETWDLRVFRQIARSEKTHMRATLSLLRRYDLPDPAAGNGVGIFTHPNLRFLYRELVEVGSDSMIAALQIGVTVEEMDISDLQQMIQRAEGEDRLTLYQNLLKGSRNHLRAFHRLLTRAGATYEPIYLSEEEYREIVSSPKERGLVGLTGELVCGGRGRRLGSG
jgi:hypothetical protein